MAFDRLIHKIDALKNPTVAGLDPNVDMIPEYIRADAFQKYGRTLEGAAQAILTFNKGLIDALCDIVPAIKPQCAYYEMYGWHGVKALAETIDYAKEKGMYVITDGKRNDIGTTMQAYTNAHIGSINIEGKRFFPFGADALTVNGYLGTNGINPLLDVCKQNNSAIFVLVKTSNPSSGELQDKVFESGKTLYQEMGELCETWGKETRTDLGYSAVGAVVGATYPEQLTQLRKELPHTFFLVPGYGAQGGGAQGLIGAFDENGRGAIVNSSRAIMYAYKQTNENGEDYALAARNEAIRMREDIMNVVTSC